jgi:hypothetical protein
MSLVTKTPLVSSISNDSGKTLYGELRTKIGSVMMNDESTIQLAINHITVLPVLPEQVKNGSNQGAESENTGNTSGRSHRIGLEQN